MSGRSQASARPADGLLEVAFDIATYSREAVLSGTASMATRVSFQVSSDRKGNWVVRLHPLRPLAADEAEHLADDLVSRVSDQQLRIELGRRTAPIRRLVYEYAFGGSRRKKA